MYFFLFFVTISVLSTVGGQSCHARFNESITGQYSSVDNCRGAILNSNLVQQQRCCIPGVAPTVPQACIVPLDFDFLYNTTRASYLRNATNYGLQNAGICENCQAKAAFLAIAATMTKNFQTDEAVASDAQFIADDEKYGNSQEGDGSRYRQRGFFGLRGRPMYERLQAAMPQFQSVTDPELVALIPNSIRIAVRLWTNPDLLSAPSLTPYADGSFYGFSMLWYELTGDIEQLPEAAKYYSIFLRQMQCGGDLYPGQGDTCQFNATHQGTCVPDCIKGLEDNGTFCGCSGPKGAQCPNSPPHIRCCLDSCPQELKMDLGLVHDASGSIGPDNYELQRNFTKHLLERANVDQGKTHVGIINYSTDVQIVTWLDENYTLPEKLDRVDEAKYFGSATNTAGALQQADTVFSYSRGRRQSTEGVTPVIFIISDGVSDNTNATIEAASVLKEKGILLVTVGVGIKLNLTELYAVCTPPASVNYFAISDYSALDQKLDQFTARSCSEPAPTSPNITVAVEISKDKYKFIQVPIDSTGDTVLITVRLFNGNVKLFYSFTNRNPKDPDDFIDYGSTASNRGPSVSTQFKSDLHRSSTKADTTENEVIRVAVKKPDSNTNVIYIGIKGIDDENKFEASVDDCDKVVCPDPIPPSTTSTTSTTSEPIGPPTSSTSMMKLSIVLLIFAGLFLF